MKKLSGRMITEDSRGSHGLLPNSSEHPLTKLSPSSADDLLFDAERNHAEMDSPDSPGSNNKTAPSKRLTWIDGVAIIVGIMIGSGVFSSPGLALRRAGSPAVDLIAWSASGILVFLAAQCYLELGGMMPSAGGDFDYIGRAFGDRTAFSFAWFNFFVSKTGSQAIIATIFGRYFEAVVSSNTSHLVNASGQNETPTSKALAVLSIVVITALNCAGIKESAYVSIFLTTIKVLLVLSVFTFAIIFAASSKEHAVNISQNLSPTTSFQHSNGVVKFGTAMVACLWCYDGFGDGNFLQEEMVNPVRDLPRIIRAGLALVTACYILINVGYFSVLSVDQIISSKAIAVEYGDAVSDMFKTSKQVLPSALAFGVSLSTIGSLNGSIMTGGRAFFAVARAGKFPKPMVYINRFGAPWVSLVAQGIWTIILLMLPGSNFSTLLDYFGPTSWLFYGLSAASVIMLRHKEPQVLRPFKVPFYPLPPLIVIAIASVIFSSSLMSEPLYTLLAVIFVALSFPVHLVMEWYNRQESRRPPTHYSSSNLNDDINKELELGVRVNPLTEDI